MHYHIQLCSKNMNTSADENKNDQINICELVHKDEDRTTEEDS